MPNLKASIKDVRKSKKRREQNLGNKANMKKAIKEFIASASGADKKKAAELLSVVFKAVDKAVKKNIIHKNNAARKKSKLSKMLKK